jgi:nucleotide-binding universal stress UspA family protein
MTTNPPIVVGVDGSPASHGAVRWAAADAVAHHRPLRLVHAAAVPMYYGPEIRLVHVDLDEFRRLGKQLTTTAAQIAKDATAAVGEVDVSIAVYDAAAVPVLTALSRTASMVVVGTSGAGAIRRGLLGSVSTSLVRHAHCPVAVIPDVDDDAQPRADGPVVVGVDGSACSALAIKIAFDEASRRDADLIAIHSWNDDGRLLYSSEIQEEGNGLLSENLAGYAEEYPEVRVHRFVTEQRPAKRLLHAAESAQLIVVGSHGRGGFAGMTLGSVSQAVLHAAQCPLIVARPQPAEHEAQP